MSITYGVTDQGFVGKPLDVNQAEIDAGLQKILGSSSGTAPDGTIPLQTFGGQLKTLMTDRDAALWDLAQAVYASFDPGSATGFSLDNVSSISGTVRDAAQFSSVVATLVGVPSTLVPAGKIAGVQTSGSQFATSFPATIVSVANWAGSTPYAVAARVTNSGNVYVCIGAGTSAGSGGPTGTGTSITDGSVTWMFAGTGTGAVNVIAAATVAGSIGANAYQLTQIVTPWDGWTGVYNASDAIPGAVMETDSALRVRRDQEAQASGNATADAIRAALYAINQGSTDPTHPPILSAKVLANDGDTIDIHGLPPHSVECIVYAPETPDADIVAAIWSSVAAGIATHGTTTSTIVDAGGNTQTVNWTRPDQVPIYITATVYYDATKWPTGTPTSTIGKYAQSALWTYGSTYPASQSVRVAPLSAQIFDGPAQLDSGGGPAIAPATASPAPGMLDATPFFIGTSPSPSTSTPITIDVRQVASFDPNNIIITAIAEAP